MTKAKETEKTEGRKDTLTFERDKTITGTRTETVTTKTEVTTTETVNSWRTDSSSSYTYASAPVPAPDPTPTTPGDGPANNNTNNVVVADPDVPLADFDNSQASDSTVVGTNRRMLRYTWIAVGIGLLALIAIGSGLYVCRKMKKERTDDKSEGKKG